ncbi:transducin/WD40 repeat protein [Trifolium pratense]|uniref:Transducin/WD40 repeat protein n=1 Tax=Trifolium pratense TaxID=57577 RepID=A0A2K3P0X3_TRIPR|nr:transducin/WD40 repeat protein [Trifolium pratense]
MDGSQRSFHQFEQHLAGKCMSEINATNCSTKVNNYSNTCSCTHIDSSQIRSSVVEALEEISALFYDEDRNGIYIGGMVFTLQVGFVGLNKL